MKKLKVIVKKGRKLFTGTLKDNVFKKGKVIKGISDVADPDAYVPLYSYLPILGFKQTRKKEKEILKEVGYSVLWVFDIVRSNTTTDSDWRKQFWGSYNPLCIECKMSCKQSSRIVLHSCPEYKE